MLMMLKAEHRAARTKGILLAHVYLWVDMQWLDYRVKNKRRILFHQLTFVAWNAPWATKSHFPRHEIHLLPWDEDRDFGVNRIKLQYHYRHSFTIPWTECTFNTPGILWQKSNFLHETGVCDNQRAFITCHDQLHRLDAWLAFCAKCDLMGLNSCTKFYDKK